MSAGLQSDLIAAVATAPGQGGIGVVRLSGPGAKQAGETICGKLLQPRQAIFCSFRDGDEVIDEGLALLFAEGASFTGEEVVELQGHGGPVVLQRLLNATLASGARLARPGEFSERAFLNGKLDLAQAEAIADLISSTSISAARAAVRSLQGAFSARVNELESSLAQLRVLVEACIDFPDEDVEFLQDGQVAQKIDALQKSVGELLQESGQGRLLNEGASVAIIGAPNAGKSSLLNALSGEETAIVTDIPGTTRDLLKVDLVLDGLPLRLVDTAGLRDSEDQVERIGVERARQQAGLADLLLVLVDASVAGADQARMEATVAGLLEVLHTDGRILVAMNKQDLLPSGGDTPSAHAPAHANYPTYWISAKTLSGLSELRRGIADALGFEQTEAGFTARARHVEALESAAGALHTAAAQLQAVAGTELVAEELRAAHMACGEIVGTVTPDELLGRIFSEFCIGK